MVLCGLLWPRSAQAGYSHHWTWLAPPPKAELALALAEMKKLTDAKAPELVVNASPESISINGVGDEGYEDFVFPGKLGFNFCKTNAQPYDEVVTAALLIARAHFPRDVLKLQSDGEAVDWEDGRGLYQEVLGKAPPTLNPDEVASPSPTGLRYRTPVYEPIPFRFGGTLMMLLLYWIFSRGSRGAGTGVSTGTYYLFWLVGPALLAIFFAHPAFLILVVVGLVLRPWLPDPFLWLRYLARTRSLQREIRINRGNVTARRDLAMLWLDKRRPKRALPLVEEALAQDPSSLQLQQLRGVCLLGLERYQEAVDCFVRVAQEDSGFAYGDPYLRAADALIALERWDDAEDALERFIDINRSSVEGRYKLALVARGRADRAARKEALRVARATYRELPRYHRRRQFSWYLRAGFASLWP